MPDPKLFSEIFHSVLGQFFLPSLSSRVESMAKSFNGFLVEESQSPGDLGERRIQLTVWIESLHPGWVGIGAVQGLTSTTVQSVSKYWTLGI